MSKLREGYKQTKVGVIPEEWEVVRLGDIFYEIKDKVGTDNIETYSISAGIGFVSQQKKFGKDISGAQSKNYIILKQNQFAYNKGNSKSYKYGCIYPNTTNKLIAVPNVFISFDFKEQNMSTQYYAKLFEHHFLDRGLRRIISSSARMDGLLNINKKYFFELPIIKPSLKEQQKIAQILSTWDSAISKQEALIKAKEQLKKGLMQKLLSGEVRFEGFDGEWEDVRFGDVATFHKGKGISKNDISDTGIECIRYGELYTKYNESIEKVYSKTSLEKSDLVLSQGNDILIPASGETAIDLATASCVLKKGIALGGDINIIRTDISGIFLSYYLNTIAKIKIASLAQGISVIHLYSSQLKSLKINLPPLKEQQKIAQVLSTADKEIELLKEELEALKEQKRGLMQRLLSGDVRVKA